MAPFMQEWPKLLPTMVQAELKAIEGAPLMECTAVRGVNLQTHKDIR